MEEEKISRLDQELMLLIIKYLEKGPCQEAAKVLTDIVETKNLLPERYDWQGETHKQSLAELASCYPNVTASFLPKICQRLCPLLDKELKPSFPGLKSLLSGGSQSLLRTEKSLSISQWSSYKYAARRYGTSLLVPNSVKVHNTVNVLRSREMAGPMSRSLVISSHKYSNIRQHYVNLGHLSAVFCVLYDKLGEIIVTGADDLLIKLWRARDGKLLATLRGCSGEISDIAIDNRNILLAAGTVDKTIRIWNLQTLAPISVLVGHQGIITGVNFCPLEVNGFNYLASTSTDGCIGFWKYKLDIDISKTVFHEPVMFNERIRPGNAHILCSSFSPGGLFLATGSGDHHVRVYKMDGVDSPLGILEVEEHTDKVDSIQWAHSHLRFVSGSRDGTALIWYYKCSLWRFIRLDMNKCLPHTKEAPDENIKKLKVTMVAWDASDRWVITAINLNFQIKIWDAFSGDLVQVLKGHTNEVFVLESHPFDSRVLLSAGHDGLVIVWDILSSKQRGHKWFHNMVDGQGEGALFDGKWSPDGTTCALTDSYGHLLVYGLGGFKRPPNIPRELFFHTDYRTLNRPNGLFEPTYDEVTNVPPHLMPPPFLVDLNGTPYPPEVQRLVPGRENMDDLELLPDITTNEEGQVEVVEGEERNPERPVEVEGQRHYNDHGHVYIQTSHLHVLRSRGGDTSAASESGSPTTLATAQSKNFVKRLPASHLRTVVDRINAFAEIESEEFARESRKLLESFPTTQPAVVKEKKKKAVRQPRTRAEYETIENQYEDPDNLSLSGSEDTLSDSDQSQVDVSDLSSSSSSSGGTPSSDYSDWIHEGVHLEPPQRVRKHTKAKPVQVALPKQAIPEEVPDIYKPSEWLAEVVPKKAPYYPQMGDEVMFFKAGYQKYVDAVRGKGIYELSRLRSSPWGNLMLQEPELVKVVGIKYEIAPPRICCLKLAVMKVSGKLTNEFFNIKYHDMPDVIDFFVLRQIYETAMSREWNVGDRFCSMIDDAWWWGVIEGKPSGSKSAFLGYKILWDNGERENVSPWDLEPLREGREPTEPGGSLPVEPEEIQELLYHPRPDEWPQGNRDATCDKIITGLEEVMGLSVAEPFLVPVDISQYPAYAYVVEYPVDLTTLRARFQNRFYRRVTSAQFDVRYLATNAEKFNEPHSHIVKYARLISDLLLRIIKEPDPIDVPNVYHDLLQSYETSSSDEEEEKTTERRQRPTAVTRAQREALNQKRMRQPFNWRTACREVLEQLWACPDSEPFRKPVDKLDHPDYDKVVIAPMDLGTIREELRGDNYESPLDFIKDVKRVFNNSRNYNQNKRSKIYIMTTRLSEFAEEHLRRLTVRWNSMKNKESKKERRRGSGEKKRRLKRRRRKIRRTLVESDEEVVSKRRGKSTYENDFDFNPSGSQPVEEEVKEKARSRRRSSNRSRSNSPDTAQPSTSYASDPQPSTSRSRFAGRAAKRKFKTESPDVDHLADEETEQPSKKLRVLYPRRRAVTTQYVNQSEEESLDEIASEASELKQDPLSLHSEEEGPARRRPVREKAVKKNEQVEEDATDDEDFEPNDEVMGRTRSARQSKTNWNEKETKEDEDETDDEDYDPSTEVPVRRRRRIAKKQEDHDEDEETNDEDYAPSSRKQTSKRLKTTKVEEDEETNDEDYAPSSRKQTSKRLKTTKAEEEEDEETNDEDYAPSSRKQTSKRLKTTKAEEEEDEETNDEDYAPSSRKQTSKRLTTKAEEEDEEETSDSDYKPAQLKRPARHGRGNTAVRHGRGNKAVRHGRSNTTVHEELPRSGRRKVHPKKSNEAFEYYSGSLSEAQSGSSGSSSDSGDSDDEEWTRGGPRPRRATQGTRVGRHYRRHYRESNASEDSGGDTYGMRARLGTQVGGRGRALGRRRAVPRRPNEETSGPAASLLLTCSGDSDSEPPSDEAGRRRRVRKPQSYAAQSSGSESEEEAAQVSFSRRGRLRKPTAKLRGD